MLVRISVTLRRMLIGIGLVLALFFPFRADAAENSFINAIQDRGFLRVGLPPYNTPPAYYLDPKTKELRQQNLDNVFGKGVFTKLVCLDTGADKDEALEEYRDSGLYWIEDKTINANLGARLGLKTILINHEHNSDDSELDSSVQRVGKWTEIVDIVVNC